MDRQSLRVIVLAALALAVIAAGARAQVSGGDDLASVPRMSMLDFAAQHASGRVLVVDVRTEVAFRAGHIPGAIHVPLPDVEARAADVARRAAGRSVVTYCACPAEQTSAVAASALLKAGLKGVRALAGGLDGWVLSGGRIEK
jgi:rhodanese-related sulfurtransferase